MYYIRCLKCGQHYQVPDVLPLEKCDLPKGCRAPTGEQSE